MTVLEATSRFTANARTSRVRRWLIAALVAVVAVAAVWLVWFSSVLTVTQVRVVGATNVSADSVLRAAAVPPHQQLARVDAAGITARVAALPRVATVEVRRGWPNSLVIAITERTPIAAVVTPGGLALVDASGVTFGSVAAAPKGMPVITASTPDALTSASAVVAALPPSLRAGVATVTARTHDDVVLRLVSGPTVRWGSVDQSDRKAAVLTALLKVKASSYDVSAPDLPTSTG